MLLGLTMPEIELIRDYRCAPDRVPLIRRYAELTHLSLGRAEDALDLWVHLLEPPAERTSVVRRPGAEAA
ncbi:MAG TPA: hypothetical protein VMH80_13285 [Bryobacteraceae bacterium]|nr:hypothetical protein [Bryobacteraceae bacterium]